MFQSIVNTLSGVHVVFTFCISTYLTDMHVRVTQVKMRIDVNACTGEDEGLWMYLLIFKLLVKVLIYTVVPCLLN